MPTIPLKVTSTPADTVSHYPSQSRGPLFRGTGDTDYLCGNCGFVIAARMGQRQHVSVDATTCSACGATNEFPRELRS